jgi:hypothetical protein
MQAIVQEGSDSKFVLIDIWVDRWFARIVKATEIEKNAIFSLHRLTVPVKQR